MKKLFVMIISMVLLFGAVISPVYAGGGKVQHENGSGTAPGPGSDAQDNQVDGE